MTGSAVPSRPADVEELMQNAATALGHARAQGGKGIQFYAGSMNDEALHRLTLESELRRATNNRFSLSWDPSRPDNWQSASVTLINVDQADPFGATDTCTTKVGIGLACQTFTSVPA